MVLLLAAAVVMPTYRPDHVLAKIRALFDDTELSNAEVAVETGLSKRTIERMRVCYECVVSFSTEPVNFWNLVGP